MQARRTATKHYEQGRVLHEQGKLANAERAYKKAIKIDPDFVEAHNNLGTVLLDRGRLKEASNAFRKALKLLPDHPMLLNNIGNVLQLQGENKKALSWFEQAINRDPGLVDAYGNLGNALQALDRNDEAVEAYRRALAINPDLADTYYNLGLVLIELDETEEAIHCFNQALRIHPADKDVYLGLGSASSAQGNLDQAVAAYQKAIEIDPLYPKTYVELGKAYADHGEIEEAISGYRKALEINPGFAKAYLPLAQSRKFTEHDHDVTAMESLLSKNSISVDDRIQLAFALGKAHEDLGNFDQSMELVIEATGLKRKTYDFSIAESRQQFDRIKEVFSPDFLSSHRDSGDPDRTPVFILGMPRSGTSLVEQILASHPDVYGAGELKDLGKVFASIKMLGNAKQTGTIHQQLLQLDARAFADLGRQYISRIRRFSDSTKLITDKMPHNFRRIGFIRTILPNARVIHCTRDPMDNCLSIFKNFMRNGHGYADNMSELGQYYRMYLELMDYWRTTLPGFVYDLSYEALVSSQQQQVSSLLQYCGLPWDDACLDFHQTRRKIKTSSNAQVLRPIYKDSVKLWTRYERQLEPLRAAIYE